MLITKNILTIPVWPGLIIALSLFLTSCEDSLPGTETNSGDDSNSVKIDSAKWSSEGGGRLTVRGQEAEQNSVVTLIYGSNNDNGAVLGTTVANANGDWGFLFTDIMPVPCDVTIENSGYADDSRVQSAPDDCSNSGTAPPPQVNAAPVLSPIGIKTVTLGSELEFTVRASDDGLPDNSLSLTTSNLPSGASFTDYGDGTGRFLWTSASPAGNTNITLTASDGDLTDSETIAISVEATPPPENTAPVLASIGDKSVLEGDDLSFTVSATDDGLPNGSLIISASSLPSGALFTDNGNGVGSFTWTNVGPVDSTDTTFIVSDGDHEDEETITIMVQSVTPPPEPLSGNFTILAANDLGMHCADQDFRIFSILPPYNVLNAQVLKKGAEPQMMSPADGVHVTYQAVESNYFSDLTDPERLPEFTDSMTTTGTNLPGVFKNNFWEAAPASGSGIDKIGFKAYESLYPPGILAMFPSVPDLGLPAPDVVHYYQLSNPRELLAEQATMPGILTNEPQPFHGYVEDFPFFVDFAFGYTVTNFKRYTAEGIPISSIDDMGRSNPYPLLRVEARDAANNVLASVDAVAPVASEADCAICHAVQNVCDFQTNSLVCDDIANFKYPDVEFIEDAVAVIGDTPEQKVINSAKTNILRLHDFKHNTSLAGYQADGSKLINGVSSTPDVVCASCHYSPALDLAHLGPNDMNGKQQTQHISMSRAMHGVHGSLATHPDYASFNLFPTMPPPGIGRDPAVAKGILMETCYNCHPGKRAECLRGAMGGSGTVCQDCHGQLTQVGDDFSEGFPADGFPAGADLTKRVSWASEPGCDSCHVGDVLQVEQLGNSLNDTVINVQDSHGNSDGLRLLMTYKLANHKVNNGPDNLPLLKFPDSRFATTEALYRLSGSNAGNNQGHGGLSCEGCHGSTHAIWPNANPYANDNKAANDIQGHSGPIIECSSCHEGDLGNTLDGPHGMHPVGRTKFADGGHEDMAEHNKNSCRACHGQNGEGTVLSRAAADRDFRGMERGGRVTKGTPITCSMCHSNEL